MAVSRNVRVQIGNLEVERQLYDVVGERIAPGTGVEPEKFWAGVERLVTDLAPKNQMLLARRDELQLMIDNYHRERMHQPHDSGEYERFLREIGYIVDCGESFTIATENVDSEISLIAAPQLVVPVTNARYALNAVNARWGSLYDALYGTDVLPETDGERGRGYNPARGKQVMAYGSAFLDKAVPLAGANHGEVVEYVVEEHGAAAVLVGRLADGSGVGLADSSQFKGYRNEGGLSLLLVNNGLHLEIQIDRQHPVGKDHPAGVKDIVLEAALTTICDCEDSVAAVDGEDKALTYSNWLGLNRGDLTTSFRKGEEVVERTLNPDRRYTALDGSSFSLSGRSVMLVRNVGHLMTTPAVLLKGEEIPEGMLDTMVTAYVGLHQLRGNVRYANSKTGSIYIVKPKMHGPDEVAFAAEIFTRAEQALGLPVNTLKIGIMDEERRTTVNLKECIRQVRERIIFINTGFLDRTGDEIHTSMEAGAMVRKEAMKHEAWINGYEDQNVDVGLEVGFSGRAQIGKGMWAKPDLMAEMVETKIGHLQAGANCAWVPSPTAATLHAMHYHLVDVFAVQAELAQTGPRTSLGTLLTIPLLQDELTAEEIQKEIDNNAQSILGYVVRWVEQGIGCSKVPDITDVGLMEDRATLRISSQYLANWILHGVCSAKQVMESLKKMAATVDRQNEGDPAYRPMAADFAGSVAFQAACDLVFDGHRQPNGYTEPILHRRRLEAKEVYGG